MHQRIILLGPQRLEPNLVKEVDRLGIDGQIAAITAGWQEREAEDDELQQHLGRPVVDLRLHQRLEQAFSYDDELFQAHRARQDRLRETQRLYRYRLDFVLEPARELMRRQGDRELLEPEREAAIQAIRTLDHDHLERIRAVDAAFEARWRPHERPAIARHRTEIRDILEGSAAIAVAGGHVAVLLNRMRLFGITSLLGDLPIFCWSAGAMALSERIVLFHDSPPQGAGNPEVLELGLGLFPDVVALPHARRRLRLGDSVRVALFARRFAPSRCIALDEGAVLRWRGPQHGWQANDLTRQLSVDGDVVRCAAVEVEAP